MAFPSNPNNGDKFNRFGREYSYDSNNGKWSAVKAVASSTLASYSINTLSDIDLQTTAPQDGDALAWDSAVSKFVPTAQPKYIVMTQPGTITAPFTGLARAYPPIDITISSMKASVGTAPSADLVFDLMKNGVSVQSFTVVAGEYTASQLGLTISVTTTDYLSINIISGTGATDLKVDFKYTAA